MAGVVGELGELRQPKDAAEQVDALAVERARMLEGLADVARTMMAGMGHGPFATLSLRRLPEADATSLGGRQPSKLG